MTQFSRVPLIVVIVMLGFVSTACGLRGAQTATATRTPYMITGIVTMTPTRSATAIAYSTETPYPTPTPFVLSERKPTDLNVLRFIFNHRGKIPNGEYLLQQLERGDFDNFTRQNADLNGDGVPEIIVTGNIWDPFFPFIAVVSFIPENLHGQGRWHELFYEQYSGHYCGNIQASIRERRLIVDTLTCWGGSGVFNYSWEQQWIQCDKSDCREVWSGMMLFADRGVSSSSVHTFVVGEVDSIDSDKLEFTTRRFEVAEVPSMDIPPGMTRRIVGPDTRQVYQWDGKKYNLASSQQIAPRIEIVREFDLQTKETDLAIFETLRQPFKIQTHVAISYDSEKVRRALSAFWGMPPPRTNDSTWPSEYFAPDAAATDEMHHRVAGVIAAKDRPVCRLTVQERISGGFELIGRADVLCTPNFTRLFWVDVDGDGNDELLLLTIPPFSLVGRDIDISAIQRLHVFSVGKTLLELAKIDGAINAGDGVGIKWENTENGFRLFTGLPLAKDDNCGWSFACVTLERHFQTYRWDKATSSFSLMK